MDRVLRRQASRGLRRRGRDDTAFDGQPLGVRLAHALQAEGAAQREGLRSVGDASLFVAGFFSDSLHRRLVDSDYYIALGANAYGRLAGDDHDAFADVFGEMADKFVPLVDVLAEISDRASLRSNRELLRLYDRWLRTGSRRDESLLAERGLVPGAAVSRRVPVRVANGITRSAVLTQPRPTRRCRESVL